MNILKKFFLRAKDFFFPETCALCAGNFVARSAGNYVARSGGSLIDSSEIRYGLCLDCQASIDLVQGNKREGNFAAKCEMCGKPLISEIGMCLPCRNGGERSYERLWVLFPYIGKYRKLLTAYKFGKNFALADFFAEKIMEEISGISAGLPELKDAVIVPVPPRPGKIKETGWDQIDYLVKRLEKLPGCPPVCRCLRRKKSKAQKNLSRAERLENLKGRIYINNASAAAFFGGASAAFSGFAASSSFILIDDVITTGSTIEVCSAVLKEAGAKKVYGICLFFD